MRSWSFTIEFKKLIPAEASNPMAEKKSSKKSASFSAEERAAMRDYIQEKKAGKTDDEPGVLAKIAGMPEPDRSLAKRLHSLIRASAPNLTSRLWYGMPAYSKDDKVVCFFQPAHKFKARYGTLGFSDKAALDDGQMWPTSFAVTKLTPAEEKKIAALVKKAVS
jgi:uncharacterized protein YdhG (YjbR/CyaY superfamily)